MQNIFFNINGKIIGPKISTLGLPQGCILSPTLYLIYTRKLYSLLSPDCIIIEFADDIVILVKSKDPNTCLTILQNNLNILSNFLSIRGLVCPDKTKLILFNHLKINLQDPNLNLKINNITIFPSLQSKLLGITLDYKMSFEFHFKFLL